VKAKEGMTVTVDIPKNLYIKLDVPKVVKKAGQAVTRVVKREWRAGSGSNKPAIVTGQMKSRLKFKSASYYSKGFVILNGYRDGQKDTPKRTYNDPKHDIDGKRAHTYILNALIKSGKADNPIVQTPKTKKAQARATQREIDRQLRTGEAGLVANLSEIAKAGRSIR
jgi:hypothetical protein